MSPGNETKLSQSFKVILEMKKDSNEDQEEGFGEKSFFISGLTKEKVILEKDVWASQVELIEKMTCFLKVGEKWKEHKISGFYTGKKATENSARKKDRMVKSFSFLFDSAERKVLFEKDLSDINP